MPAAHPDERGDLAAKLLVWYDKNRRVLPWRALRGVKPDPYQVWLSEIMLQQTTVAAVGPYFRKFVTRWPTVQALAKTKLDDVMRLWAGLGYYRRARALHETAQIICREFGGAFPATECELRALPGCGPYTAAAIAAIAFDQRANVVDGNIERIMARFFAVKTPMPTARPKLRILAGTLLPEAHYGDYAQALMDLGAMICTPRNPKCGLCPWAAVCVGREKGIMETLPRRQRKKAKPVRRAIAFYLTNKQGAVLLRKRPAKGLLAGMMEIPASEWRVGPMPKLSSVRGQAPAKARWKLLPGTIRHTFSHFNLELRAAVATSSSPCAGRWVKPGRMKHEALPSVMSKIIVHAQKAEEDQRGKKI